MSYVLDAGNENSKVIHITSTDATHELSSEGAFLKYDLETPIITPENQDTLVSLYSAVVPYSFYNIREGVNDKVYYKLDSEGGAVLRSFIIPKGSYTINSLKTELETSFNLASNNFVNTTTSIAFNRITMKYEYTQTEKNSSGRNADWFFAFDGTTDGAEVCLGLPVNYDGNTTSFIQRGATAFYDFVSPDVPDVNGDTHSLNIRTNLTSKGCIDSHTKSFSTILGTIPIDVNFGGVVFFRPADAIHKIVIQQKVIKTITIRLTDDRDRLLHLNGLSFNITLLIDHIKHGRNLDRRISGVKPDELIRLEQKPKKRGRPRKNPVDIRRTKKDIPIPLIN